MRPVSNPSQLAAHIAQRAADAAPQQRQQVVSEALQGLGADRDSVVDSLAAQYPELAGFAKAIGDDAPRARPPAEAPRTGGNAALAYLGAQAALSQTEAAKGRELHDAFSVYPQLVAKNDGAGLTESEKKLFTSTAQAINLVRQSLREMHDIPVDAFRTASSAQRLQLAVDAAWPSVAPQLDAVNQTAGGRPYETHARLQREKGSMTGEEAQLYTASAQAINELTFALQALQLSGAVDMERFRTASPDERIKMVKDALEAELQPRVKRLEDALESALKP